MSDPITGDVLIDATTDLLIALRDSLTDVSPMDFWSGRAVTALETAAAGSEDAGQAVTTACRKLQIPVIAPRAVDTIGRVTQVIGADYERWAAMISRESVYLAVLAKIKSDGQKEARKTARKKDAPITMDTVREDLAAGNTDAPIF